MQVELQQQLEEYQTNNVVPQDWRLRLDEAIAGLAEFIGQFVRGQAQAAVTIPLLRDLWTEFQRLRGEDAESRVEMSEDWFSRFSEALTVGMLTAMLSVLQMSMN